MEEVKYCIHCGTKNIIKDVQCINCHKTIDPKENQFKDYLYEKTKDKLKGNIDDNLFEIIKNYLLSHLYGVFLTLTIISVIFTSTLTNTNIEYVTNTNNNTQIVDNFYSSIKDYAKYSSWNPDDSQGGYEKFLALILPSSYNYQTTHEMAYSERENHHQIGKITFTKPNIDPQTPQTYIGQQLMDDGYTIAETKITEEYLKYNEPMGKATYLVTSVYIDNQWYIAEDILIDETYYSVEADQETLNAIDTLINKYFSYYNISLIEQKDLYSEFKSLEAPTDCGYTSFGYLLASRGSDEIDKNEITYELSYNSYSPQSSTSSQLLYDKVPFAELNVNEKMYTNGEIVSSDNYYVIVAKFDNTWYVLSCEKEG